MNFRNCEIVTNLEYIDLNNMKNVLLNNSSILNYAYIIHDSDVYNNDIVNDGVLIHRAGDKKNDHIHLLLKLDNSYKGQTIGNWFGIKENYICKIKGRFRDALEYLTHANATDKFQYSVDDVVSNFDFVKYIENEKKKQNNKISKKQKDEELNNIISLIEVGEIREYNQFDKISIDIWSRNKTLIKNALEYYKERIFMDKNRKINVLFFTGDTGTGKTTFAKFYAEQQNKSICISSSSNDVMQDYKGEDILVLDDLRDDSFSFSDLLKILDLNTKSTMKSRYVNKGFIGDTVIITSYKDIEKWYPNIGDENKAQLFRRVKYKYVFYDDIVNSYHYDKIKCKYICDGSFENNWNYNNVVDEEDSLSFISSLGINVSKDLEYSQEKINFE